MLAMRAPDGAVATLLAYLPYADSDASADQLRELLSSLAVHDSKAVPYVEAPARYPQTARALFKLYLQPLRDTTDSKAAKSKGLSLVGQDLLKPRTLTLCCR